MISADDRGELVGKFRVPANVPVGVKPVLFRGKDGSFGSTTYTGSGTITFETLRRVTTVTSQRYDPLAQTFTLEQSRFIAGVELWFKAKGVESVQVQIREVLQGIPTQTVIAESELESTQINTDGKATLFEFSPVFLEAAQEYAIVVLTDGAEHSVAIAELGKHDKVNGWVTSQPYQVGVLLSSSNASTWTPHQTKDLAFKLKAAKFTNNTKRIALGTLDLTSYTDLMMLAVVQRSSAECDVEFEFSHGGEVVLRTKEWLPHALEPHQKKSVEVEAILTGSATQSPQLLRGTQIAKGRMEGTAEYVSRAFICEQAQTLQVIFDVSLEAGTQVKLEVETGNGVFEQISTPTSTLLTEDNWTQLTYTYPAFPTDKTRVKLILVGQDNKRPKVRNLRAFS